MDSNGFENISDSIVYDCTRGTHTVVLISGEIVIDCVAEAKKAVKEPRIDIHV